MAVRWSYTDSLKLIELYKSHDLLWNKNSDQYKNFYARKQAYDEILEAMNIPKLSAQDIRSKIKNLRSAYYLEHRRMETSKTCKKDSLKWFHAIKPIMGHIEVKKEDAVEGSDCESTKSSDDNPEVIEESSVVEESTENADAYVVSIKQEYLDEMENQDVSAVGDYLEPVTKKAKVYEQPNPVKKEKKRNQSAKHKIIDEFQMFGNNIAAQLRRMPLDRALFMQVEVQTMIAKDRVQTFKRQKERKE